MRAIDELLPDVTLAASGAPVFTVVHALTRSLARFLSESEAWREWSYDVDPLDIVDEDGVWDFEKHIDPSAVDYDDFAWLRTKRVDILKWGNERDSLIFKTNAQLDRMDREWRTREAQTPTHYTHEGDGGGGVRFVAVPNGTDYEDLVVKARLVMITNVTSHMGVSALDELTPELPDRLFERYREAIVAGALAILYAMPGRDWTNLGQVDYQRKQLENAIMAAKSEADADYGNPENIMAYGGIP